MTPFLLPLLLRQAPTLQVWEKPVVPGLVYRMEVESNPARIVHILRYTPTAGTARLLPQLAGGVVYSAPTGENAEGRDVGDTPSTGPDTMGRASVSRIVRETSALAGVNADFFPFTGDPLGLMVRDGALVSAPHPTRSAFVWGPAEAAIGRSAFYGYVTRDGEKLFGLDGLNEECPLNRIVLNTSAAGRALGKSPNAMALVKLEGDRLTPSAETSVEVVAVLPGQDSLAVPPGQAVLVGQGERAVLIKGLKPGEKLGLRMETSGFAWDRYDEAIGGGPRLLTKGEVDVPYAEEGFGKAFSEGRNPRTAVGITASGDWILAVADGRSPVSVGATLPEMAVIMRRQGCTEALNLDGGGSSAMNLLGLTISRPSDKGGERPVANALVVQGLRPRPIEQVLRLRLPKTLVQGLRYEATVTNAAGQAIPNTDVLWAMQGDAWIDGGGNVRPISAGSATIQALVRGQTLSLKVAVIGRRKE